ncbi:MAG: hypothetical protein ABIO95_00705, partial [Bdellovibrionota bacterium]
KFTTPKHKAHFDQVRLAALKLDRLLNSEMAKELPDYANFGVKDTALESTRLVVKALAFATHFAPSAFRLIQKKGSKSSSVTGSADTSKRRTVVLTRLLAAQFKAGFGNALPPVLNAIVNAPFMMEKLGSRVGYSEDAIEKLVERL